MQLTQTLNEPKDSIFIWLLNKKSYIFISFS